MERDGYLLRVTAERSEIPPDSSVTATAVFVREGKPVPNASILFLGQLNRKGFPQIATINTDKDGRATAQLVNSGAKSGDEGAIDVMTTLPDGKELAARVLVLTK